MNEFYSESGKVLSVRHLRVHFPLVQRYLPFRRTEFIRAVDDISFDVGHGETFSLVGESGSGKSTTALAIQRMVSITGGKVVFRGEDITHLGGKGLRTVRRNMQMVYQDPYGSLNPRMKARDIIGEPLVVHGMSRRDQRYRERVAMLMSKVGLGDEMQGRYPHEFSGGQRQRISIARALALDPELLILDEAVSALDVSVQAQVLNLLMALQRQLNLSYLFISHDLSVVRHIATDVGVMYLGRLVEVASRDDLFKDPKHPYTRALIDAVPVADPGKRISKDREIISGEMPSVQALPSGCRFHSHCPHATDLCKSVEPELKLHDNSRLIACHLYG